MWMPKVKFEDDAGRDVWLLDTPRRRWQGQTDPRLRPMWESVTKAMSKQLTSLGLVYGLFCGVGILGVRGLMQGMSPYYQLLAVICVTWPVFFAMLRIAPRLAPASWKRVARSVADITLREGVCAQCTHNLHQIVPNADGRLACPECGAAWNASRVVRTGPVAEASAARGWWQQIVDAWIPRNGAGVDARGASVSIRLPHYAPAREARTEAHRALLRAVRREAGRVALGKRATLASLVLVVGLAHLAGSLLVGVTIRGVLSLPLVLGGVVYVLLALYLWRSRNGADVRRIRDVYLDHRVCPSCLADLREEAPAEDGCVECLTCLAAWRTPGEGAAPTPRGQARVAPAPAALG